MYYQRTNFFGTAIMPTIGGMIAAIFLSGCGTSPDNNANTANTGTDPVTCADATSESDCLAIAGCNPIDGLLIDVEKECAGPNATFLACSEEADTCEDVETMGIDPETGDCYHFGSLCLPEGFEHIDYDHPSCPSSDLCDDSPNICLEIETEAECVGTEGCMPIRGRKTDIDNQCVAIEQTFLSCEQNQGCDGAMGGAFKPGTSDCYQFTSLCFPTGWQDLSGYDEDCANLPVCNAE